MWALAPADGPSALCHLPKGELLDMALTKKSRLPVDWREILEARGILEYPPIPPIEKLIEAIAARKGIQQNGSGLDGVTRAKVGLPGPDGMVYGEAERADAATALCQALVEALQKLPVQSTLPGTDGKRPMDDQPHIDVTYGAAADDQGDQPEVIEFAELPAESTFEGETWEAPAEPTVFDPTERDADLWLATQIPMGVTRVEASQVWEQDGLVDRPAHWLLHAGYAYDAESGNVVPLMTADKEGWIEPDSDYPHSIFEPIEADRELWMTPAFVPPMVSIEGETDNGYDGLKHAVYWLDNRYSYHTDGDSQYPEVLSWIEDEATGEYVWKSWKRGEKPSDDAPSGEDAAIDAGPESDATSDDSAAPGATESVEEFEEGQRRELARQAEIVARANASGYHLIIDQHTRQAIDATTGVPVAWRYLEKNFGVGAVDAAAVPVIEQPAPEPEDKPKKKRARKPKTETPTETVEYTMGIEVTTGEDDEANERSASDGEDGAVE